MSFVEIIINAILCHVEALCEIVERERHVRLGGFNKFIDELLRKAGTRLCASNSARPRSLHVEQVAIVAVAHNLSKHGLRNVVRRQPLVDPLFASCLVRLVKLVNGPLLVERQPRIAFARLAVLARLALKQLQVLVALLKRLQPLFLLLSLKILRKYAFIKHR